VRRAPASKHKVGKMAEVLLHKSIDFQVAEIKTKKEKGTYEGYASTFGNEDSYGDIIEPGAFRKTISERGPMGAKKIKGLWEHFEPFGTIEQLTEDSNGLYMVGKASDTQENKDRLQYMADGVVDSMSIGFSIPEGKSWWEDDGGWMGIRHIEEVKLYEISVVMFPANELATIASVRKAREVNELLKMITPDELMQELKEFDGIDIRAIDRALEVLTDIKTMRGGDQMEIRALRRQQEPTPVVTPPATPEPPAADDPDEIAAKNAHELLTATLASTEINQRMSELFR
jgi:HK97 family phage prohead protease